MASVRTHPTAAGKLAGRAAAPVSSLTSPAVVKTFSGRPFAHVTACSLVFRTPFLRPISHGGLGLHDHSEGQVQAAQADTPRLRDFQDRHRVIAMGWRKLLCLPDRVKGWKDPAR